MRLTYDRGTDSLYIHLSETPAAESRPLADNVVADFDVAGNLVGLDVQYASTGIDLSRLELVGSAFQHFSFDLLTEPA